MSTLGFFVAHMARPTSSVLVISVAVCGYLLYALLRGERF